MPAPCTRLQTSAGGPHVARRNRLSPPPLFRARSVAQLLNLQLASWCSCCRALPAQPILQLAAWGRAHHPRAAVRQRPSVSGMGEQTRPKMKAAIAQVCFAAMGVLRVAFVLAKPNLRHQGGRPGNQGAAARSEPRLPTPPTRSLHATNREQRLWGLVCTSAPKRPVSCRNFLESGSGLYLAYLGRPSVMRGRSRCTYCSVESTTVLCLNARMLPVPVVSPQRLRTGRRPRSRSDAIFWRTTNQQGNTIKQDR